MDGKSVKSEIDAARHKIAQLIGARSEEIIFTAGATESCNLAIKGIMNKYADANIVISNIEHSAVKNTAANYEFKQTKVLPTGLIDLRDLTSQIDDRTVLISIIHANNEIGVVQNLSQVADLVREVRVQRKQSGNDLPILLHSDASQSGNYLDLHASRLGVDLLTINGGKMYGPKQSGILYVKSGVILVPQIDGGGQEWGLRSGTENVANIVGFTEAFGVAQASRKDESHRLEYLRDYLIGKIEQDFPTFLINGTLKHRLPNNVNFSIPDVDGERLVMMLDEVGVQCATGAACSAQSDESSHVIKALGRSEQEAKGSIRLSFGRGTTKEEIDEFYVRFCEVVKGVL